MTSQILNNKTLTIAIAIFVAFVMLVAPAANVLADHSIVETTVGDPGECGATTITSSVSEGTNVSNMFLVVYTEEGGVQIANIPTDEEDDVSITVGPFSEEDVTVQWRVFGGGERNYDEPHWNGLDESEQDLQDDVNAYFDEVDNWDWTLAGPDDPNEFTTWNSFDVDGCEEEEDKVRICHAAGKSGNYTENEVAKPGLNGHDGHSHSNDIIPPFGDGDFENGQNWDEGQAIWENGCKIPEPEPELSTLNVCKIIVDNEGNVIDGDDVDAEFSINIEGSDDFATTTTFTTPLTLTNDLVDDNDGDLDAQCVSYDVPAGEYTYEEQEINDGGAVWGPTYHDFFDETPQSIEDFFLLTQDGEEGDEDNADGVINLGQEDERTLAIVNTLEELPVDTATLVAHKIVCDAEEYLPNWAGGNNGAPQGGITETTAEDFVDGNNNCHLESGWDFQWAPKGTGGPEGSHIGEADGFTSFGPTNEDGVATTTVSIDEANGRIEFREVLQEGYIAFSDGGNNDHETPSAEIYCDAKMNQYDNGVWIDDPEAGDTINCVAFNVPVEVQQTASVEMCKLDGSETPLEGWTLTLTGEEVDEFEVSAETSAGTDSDVLTSGMSYVATVMGTWLNDRSEGPNHVDAEYSTVDEWETHMDGFTGYGEDILEVQVGEQFVNWGPFNNLHIYATSFSPDSDGPVNFRIFDGTGEEPNDSWYHDNSGSLDVEIAHGFSGVTGENGCVVFDNVPYGTYTAGEIMQDGWENESGLGEVVVDEPEESFTVTNVEQEEELLYACSVEDVLHLDVSDSNEAKLYSVNTATGVGTELQTYPGLNPLDLAADSDGTLYSTSRNGGDTGDLIILNTDGTVTTVGATGLSDKTTAMNFAPDGTLYAMGTDEDNLYEINKTNGVATLLHSFEELDVAGGDLVVNAQNQLVYVHHTGDVYVINLTTYDTTLVGSLPSGDYTSTALVGSTYYAMDNSGNDFVSFGIDPFTSSVVDSGVGPFNHGDGTSCPVPAESYISLPEEQDPYKTFSQGDVPLAAFYADENGDGDDAVQWAVREGTCDAGSNTVAGNVDGFNTPFSWDSINFSSTFDGSSATPGDYCFIFNPTEDSGDEDQRLTRWFTIEGDEDDDSGSGGGDGGDDKVSETIIVTHDTSAGYNQLGWLFARDPDNQTDYQFVGGNPSIGIGSLHVLPIDPGNGSDKFIAENFLFTSIADIESISYDFMIDDSEGATDSDKAHFYMNVYANFGDSSPTNYYDCKYDVVPTVGSTGSFTTVTFDPTQDYPVTGSGCPDAPADMDNTEPESIIRALSLNVGDTSTNDTNVGGWLDNVVVTTVGTTTTYDFEPLVSTETVITNESELGTPSLVGESFTVEWDVTPDSGSDNPTGTVDITFGGGTTGCEDVQVGTNGVGQCDITPVATSSGMELIVYYSGDDGFAPSQSDGVPHDVVGGSGSDGGSEEEEEEGVDDLSFNPPVGSGGIFNFTGFSSGPGIVLGASTESGEGQVLGDSCEPLLTTYLRRGYDNNPEEVLELQKFLQEEVPPGPRLTAVFDEMTEQYVNEFQMKYADEILVPWHPHGLEENTPTGYVYKTTRRWVNLIHCSSLNIPFPILP